MPDTPLTIHMEKALILAEMNGGKLTRQPGGFWFGPSGKPPCGTSTVQALVDRGYLHYSVWQPGRNGRFPIEAMIQKELA